jgi:amino acid adenylation domain-containing protein
VIPATTRASALQRALWLGLENEGPSASYNVALGIHVRGDVSQERLLAACDAAARRHPQLRTTFHPDDDDLRCQIHDAERCSVRLVDADDTERLRALIERESARPFDLSQELPSRWWLARLPDRHHHVLLIVVHHIVFDVRSSELLAATLLDALAGVPTAAPSTATGRRDGSREGRVLSRLEQYASRLNGSVPPICLPFDRPWTPGLSLEGDEVRLAGTEPAVARACERLGCSEWQLYLLAYGALLHRYGNDELPVGVAMSARRPWERNEIGYFVNTLPVPIGMARTDTARSLLQKLGHELRVVYGLREVTIADVVERVRPWRIGPVHALLQTGASYVRYEDRLSSSGVEVEIEHLPARGAKSPLLIGIRRSPRAARVRFEYASGLFERGTVERVAAEYGRLLTAIAEAPDEPLSRLHVLGDAGRRRLIALGSRPGTDRPTRWVNEVIADRAAERPGAPAVGQDDRVLSYGELERLAGQLAGHLRGLGVGPEVLVGVCMQRSPERVVAVLAILKAGGAYLPLDPEHPPERLATMLGGTGSQIVVADQAGLDSLPGEAGILVCVDRDRSLPESLPAAPPRAPIHPHQLAYVIHTSGSTGQPKGVMVSHEALANTIAVARRQFHVDDRSTVLQAASFSFDVSVLEMFLALTAGARLQLLPAGEGLSGEVLDHVLRKHEVSVMVLPPSVLDLVPGPDYPALRTLVVGGEACQADTIERWAPGRRLLNGYGPAEAAIYATAKVDWTDYDPASGPPPIGTPIPNAVIRVLDRDGGLAPTGVPGELCIGGVGVARGYAGQPAQTAERFVPDPFAWRPGERLYRTGDAARWLSSRELEFIGRLDAQVKVRGYRIEPGEIEAVLRRHPKVRECVVAARHDDEGRLRLVGYVVRAGSVPLAELREHLLRRLPRHMVPTAWVFLEEIPLTSNGKVDRAALPAPGRASPPDAPDGGMTPVEDVVATMCAEMLNLPAVHPAQDLFELGADSIFATNLVARLRTGGFELPLRAVFETPTVCELADRLTAAERAAPIIPLEDGAERPLSLAQERLWLLDDVGGGSPEYNVPIALRLRGELDVPALEAALAGVIARHEALRSTFPTGSDGWPGLRVTDAGAALTVLDLAAEPNPESAAGQALAGEIAVTFDLARGPLVRAVLCRLGRHDHVLALCLHHVVFDGWSAGVLASQLEALYAARRQGRPAALPHNPVQYADYAAWQRERLYGDRMRRQLAYWRERLAGAPNVLDLPLDRPRPPVRTSRGRRVAFDIPPDGTALLRGLGRRRGATLFMVLLAGFQALLSRYAAATDVVVGSPVSGRPGPETDGVVGLFTNMVALRADCSGDPRFTDLLGQVRESTVAALAHQDLPFELLLEELALDRRVNVHPLFQVVFTMQDDAGTVFSLDGLSVERFPLERRTAKYDLTLTMTPTGAGLAGELECATDVFEPATAERMAAHLRTLLAGVAADPERRLSALPLTPAEERRRLVADWNAVAPTRGNGHRSIPDLVAEHAVLRPTSPAVHWRGTVLTYGRLLELADRLARVLRRHGLGPESAVAVCCERSPAQVVGALAVQRAGGAHLFLDPAHPRHRLDRILDEVGSPVLVTDRATAGRFAERPERVLTLDPDGALPGGRLAHAAGPIAHVHPETLAYVVYTSGSTGTPKGVAVPHGALANLCGWYRHEYSVGPGDVVAHVVGTAFDVAVLDVWGALGAGAALTLPPHEEARQDPERLLGWLAQAGATVAFVATPLAELMLGLRPPPGLRLRWLLVGGDKLRVPVPEGLPYRVADNYGPAECAVVSTWDEVRPGAASSVSRFVDGCRVLVASAAGEPCPAGVPGELLIGGACVSRGYLRRPDLTAERFVPDPLADGGAGRRVYRSGDLCRRRADGTLELLGRIDRQVKIRGFRVELDEVETVLVSHPGVRQAAVVMREDRPGDRRLVAYVVGGGEPAASLREHLAARLPDHMVPSAIVLRDALPVTPSGKLDRHALQPPPAEPEGVAAAPATPTEEMLAELWAGVLGREHVSVTEDFFLMGGNSLLAAEVVARLRAEGWPAASLRLLFMHSTVRTLSLALEDL